MTPTNPRPVLLAAAAIIVLSRPAVLGHHLPDATLAAFFLLGALVPSRLCLLGLLTLRLGFIVADTVASAGLAHCVTPALAAMPLAYALMWQAGRVVARHGWLRPGAWLPLLLTLASGSAAAFLVSKGSFHLLSGRVADPTWAGMLERSVRYFPGYLASALRYVLAALARKAVHAAHLGRETRA